MAEPTTIMQGLTYLETVYDKRVDDARKKVYADLLKHLPDDLLKNGIRHCAGSCKFFPTPAEILDAVAFLGRNIYRVPTSDEAWAEVTRAPMPRKTKSYCAEYIRIYNDNNYGDTAGYWRKIRALDEHEQNCEACRNIQIDYRWSHPIVEEVARRLGWPDKFWSDNFGVDRGRFMKTYEAYVEHQSDQAMMLPNVREFVDDKRALEMDKRSAFETGEQRQIAAQLRQLTDGFVR